MRQAISTKYFGPTNTRGSRIKATCQRGSITIPYSYWCNSDGAHKEAIDALIAKFVKEDNKRFPASTPSPWESPYVMGALEKGFVAVFIS